ncbi:MAG: C2 family cysteine protease [Cyanobacteria bacterium P01_G01_bin.49]
MFTDNGDGTFTVKFYKNGVADYVTVDRKLPTDSYGNSVYGNVGGHYNSSNNELWVALAEKAYAQLNESNWIGQDGTNSYQGTSGGWPKDSINHITGIDTKLRRAC